MKKAWLIIGVSIVIAGYAFYPGPSTREQAVTAGLLGQIDGFTSLVHDRFEKAVADGASAEQLRQLFGETRLAYKRFEWAAEYFDPAGAALLNGPPVAEAELVSEGGPGQFRVLEPEGLQVIEGLLFPAYDTSKTKELQQRLRRLEENAQRYKIRFANIDILGGQVFDATKLEVFRLLILGLSGFDAPLSKNSLAESAAALESLQAVIAHYTDGAPIVLFAAAAAYLRAHPGFDDFDRALFVTRYGNPLTRDLTRLRQRLQIPLIRYNRLLRQDAETLFDKDAFDADAYAPEENSAAKIALGERLFSDPRLSGDGTRSCATCHQPGRAFTDGLARNTAMGDGLLPRNTPTLLNAALQPALFYDLRVTTLEDQVGEVLADPLEMHSSVQEAALKLGIDTLGLESALAAYVRTLVRLDSRFDDYMRGDSLALDTQAVRGFNVFMGKARCGTCHYLPLFNGAFPPRYTRMETEVIGVPDTVSSKTLDGDPGRFAIVPEPFLRHAFKTPTVRNANRTAPYMHNGVFATMDQVIDFYDKGGGIGAGEILDNQTLPTDSLHLTTAEKAALIAFIKSLDSR